jgi:hypothetical protein
VLYFAACLAPAGSFSGEKINIIVNYSRLDSLEDLPFSM